MLYKKILILYHYYHHHQMVERMASSMMEYGVGVDVLCKDNLYIVNNTNQNYSFITRLLLRYFSIQRSGIVYRIIRKFFAPLMLKSLMRQYDTIDFHAFGLDYLPYMKFCAEESISFDITLWGSDIMRADEVILKKKCYGFEHCHYIKATENLLEVVNEKYYGFFADKGRIVYFGNNDFESIDQVYESYKKNIKSIRNAFVPESGDKIIVTCGYNGSKYQNHVKILEAIKKFPRCLLGKIYLLIPFTYGADIEYLREIEDFVEELGVPYSLYSNRLPIEEIAKIRLVSDVVINMQDTDAFSGSLQDHLYCRNVLIIGEWLNYVPLDKAGVYYIKTSYESLADSITKVIDNLPLYKGKCVDNREKMKHLTSWEYVLPRWAESYKL